MKNLFPTLITAYQQMLSCNIETENEDSKKCFFQEDEDFFTFYYNIFIIIYFFEMQLFVGITEPKEKESLVLNW